MWKALALGALVLTLAGCGSSSEAAGPADTAQAWVDALVAHDYQAVCDLETVEYQGLDCAGSYQSGVEGASAQAGQDVVADLKLDRESCVDDVETKTTTCLIKSEFNGDIYIVVGEAGDGYLVQSVG